MDGAIPLWLESRLNPRDEEASECESVFRDLDVRCALGVLRSNTFCVRFVSPEIGGYGQYLVDAGIGANGVCPHVNQRGLSPCKSRRIIERDVKKMRMNRIDSWAYGAGTAGPASIVWQPSALSVNDR